MIDLYLPNRLRRDIRMLRNLANAGELHRDSFDFLIDRLLATATEVQRELESIEGEPEYFAVTRQGIAALDAPIAETPPRDYGRLRCIDGGLT